MGGDFMKEEPDAIPVTREFLIEKMRQEPPKVNPNRFGNISYYFSDMKIVGMQGEHGIVYVQADL